MGKSVSQWRKHSPLNAGPLHYKILGSETIANTFRSGTYVAYQNTRPIILYRAQSGPVKTADKLGVFWTRTKPSSSMQSMIDSSLDPRWGNRATHWIKIEVPPGQTFYEGSIAPQRGLVGGGNQIYLENVQISWLKEQGVF